MATLFNKRFEDWLFEDVQSMVDSRVPESQVLDYKKQFNKHEAEKLISAMANTYGGYIVYGVECDNTTNLPLRVVNLDDKKLDDTVDSISTYNITPPVLCDNRYLSNADGSRKVFVIRVPESDNTPHAINNNTDVYIKVRGQKRPLEERASLDKIEWLQDRRKSHTKLRNALMEFSARRLDSFCIRQGLNCVRMEFQVVPLHPSPSSVPFTEIRTKAMEVVKEFRSKHCADIFHLNDPFHFNNGVGRQDIRTEPKYHVEFGTHGDFTACFVGGNPVGGTLPIGLGDLAVWARWGLGLGSEWIETIGFRGSVLVRCSIANIGNTWLQGAERLVSPSSLVSEYKCVASNECSLECKTILGFGLSDVRGIAVEFIARIIFLYGFSHDLMDRAASVYDKWCPESIVNENRNTYVQENTRTLS